MEKFSYIGHRVKRMDALDKVTGKSKYVGDLKMDGMLYGKILRSPVAHGIVKNIDITKASALPGVVTIPPMMMSLRFHIQQQGTPIQRIRL